MMHTVTSTPTWLSDSIAEMLFQRRKSDIELLAQKFQFSAATAEDVLQRYITVFKEQDRDDCGDNTNQTNDPEEELDPEELKSDDKHEPEDELELEPEDELKLELESGDELEDEDEDEPEDELKLELDPEDEPEDDLEPNWEMLCRSNNPSDMQLLSANISQIKWSVLCSNTAPCAVDLFMKYPEFFCWNSLSSNLNDDVVHMLSENTDMVSWSRLCYNRSPKAIDIIRNNLHEIGGRKSAREALSANSLFEAVSLLIENPHLIEWEHFCSNWSPHAIAYIEHHLACVKDNIHARNALSSNASAAAVKLLLGCPMLIELPAFINNKSPVAQAFIESLTH